MKGEWQGLRMGGTGGRGGMYEWVHDCVPIMSYPILCSYIPL